MTLVVLDAGHGGNDAGAVSSGLREKDLTLAITRRVQDTLLDDYDVDVALTREADITTDLHDRPALANAAGADLFVSIHINSSGTPGSASGYEDYVQLGTADTAPSSRRRKDVHLVVAALMQALGIADRGRKTKNLLVLREAQVPAMLLENLFINHPSDAAHLSDAAFIARLGDAIAAGIGYTLRLPPRLPHPRVYFFAGADYFRYVAPARRKEHGPTPITRHWKRLIGAGQLSGPGVDAALNLGGRKVYFFKGKDYSRYDVTSDTAEVGWPKHIKDQWTGLPDDAIDAALNFGNGKAYFFRGASYWRYDLTEDRVDPDYPKITAEKWTGLAAEPVDAAVNLGDGEVLFFQGPRCRHFSVAADEVTSTRLIKDEWPSLPSRVDAALEWTAADLRAPTSSL